MLILNKYYYAIIILKNNLSTGRKSSFYFRLELIFNFFITKKIDFNYIYKLNEKAFSKCLFLIMFNKILDLLLCFLYNYFNIYEIKNREERTMLMIRILNLNLVSINGLIEPDFSDPVYKKGICRVWILKKIIHT